MTSCRYHPAIDEWMRLVEKRKVHSCREQKQLMPFLRKVLDSPSVEIRGEEIDKAIDLIEKYFFPLHSSQKFIVGLIVGAFYRETDMPVFNQVFVMAGRGYGKNGLISGLAFYFISDKHGVDRYNVDIVATSEEQAMTSFQDVYDVVADMGDKGKRLYDYNKTQVTFRRTRSRLRYRTSNAKTKDGGRPGVVIFDEVHAYEDYQTLKVFTGGLGKVERPRRIYITSDGEVRERVLDAYKERARRILTGETEHKGFLPIIFKMDSIQEVGKKTLWDKANPRMFAVPHLQAEVELEYQEMLENEGLKEAFITKRMNIPYMSAQKTVASWDDILACSTGDLPDLTGCEAVGAVDFADLRDFASVGLRFKQNGKTYFKEHTFIHEKSLELTAYNIDIRECVEKGWVTIVRSSEHPTIPASLLADWFLKQAETYYIRKVNCDSFRYGAVKEAFDAVGIPTEEVRSGSISHNKVAVPLQQMFADHTLVLEDKKLMRWYIWNVKVETDSKGNKTFKKIDPARRKTDGFFCLLHSLINDDLEETVEPVFFSVHTY